MAVQFLRCCQLTSCYNSLHVLNKQSVLAANEQYQAHLRQGKYRSEKNSKHLACFSRLLGSVLLFLLSFLFSLYFCSVVFFLFFFCIRRI